MPLIDLSLTLFDFNSVLYAVAYTLKMSYTGGISMEDDQIVDLYRARSERAVAENAHKYGRYCYSIAYNILLNENPNPPAMLGD